ncbi:MAG: hypothetical protein N2053_03615 [Chitinispirillaceae bacterium]|nr:hypothetical protein [Chitinispirillaceae bacterium]
MLKKLYIFLLTVLVLSAVSYSQTRSILEKKMFYITNTGKTGQARFWAIYLGTHECKLMRKKPGETEKPVNANLNLTLLSSGYVEGNGYSSIGKVQSLPTMEFRNESGEKKITIEDIDFIYDYGRKVQLTSGEKGDFVINVEGEKKIATKFLMREYKLTEYFGEEILKEGAEETALSAIAFSQEGLARAKKAQQEAEKVGQ